MSIKTVAVIGAGPAGLMAAEVLSQSGMSVDVYDAMPSAGRKFLMAGKGGMNITHAEPLPRFLNRYGDAEAYMRPMLAEFSPDALRLWMMGLGVDSFVGSSGRVFPREMKAAPLLRAWLHRLRVAGVRFHMRHRWIGWNDHRQLLFQHLDRQRIAPADATILALGGGSWPQLGANGQWLELLTRKGIAIKPLLPSNCGFEAAWSEFFRNRFAGQPLKPVALSFFDAQGNDFHQQGELVITDYGLEGGAIYALSRPLRQQIQAAGSAILMLDLLPQRPIADVIQQLAAPRGKQSLSNVLRKRLGFDGVKSALVHELTNADCRNDPLQLAQSLKAMPVTLSATRPLAEAISSAGGVALDELDDNLMLKQCPGVFCAGEMLDWEAPTGGYLLTACLANGRAAGFGASRWLLGS